MIVFLERGAAAGGVGDDGVEVFTKKRGEILSREIASGIANSGVRGERAAAELIFRDDHFAAVGGEYADGGFVELRESDVGDAACKEGHAGPARTGGGKCRAEMAIEKIFVDAREEAFAFGQPQEFQDAGGARDGLQAGALIEAQDVCGVDETMRFGKKVPENKIARGAGKPGARIVAFDARAGVLDEFSIFDSRGAGGFASAAVEAFVDVIDEGIGEGLVVQLDVDHLVNAAAGRIGLEIPEAVGRTGVEAEATVDTTGVVLIEGNLAGDGRRGHGWLGYEGRFYGT
jgi:hypothetical protein